MPTGRDDFELLQKAGMPPQHVAAWAAIESYASVGGSRGPAEPRHYAATAVQGALNELTAAADAEVDRLRGILSGDATLLHTSYSEGSPLEMAIRHPLILAQVAAIRGVLDSCDAENYVECIYSDADGQQYVVTFQRKFGKTPHELRRIAEQERDASVTAKERSSMLLEDALALLQRCRPTTAADVVLDINKLLAASDFADNGSVGT